jgi:hypothetical protein
MDSFFVHQSVKQRCLFSEPVHAQQVSVTTLKTCSILSIQISTHKFNCNVRVKKVRFWQR